MESLVLRRGTDTLGGERRGSHDGPGSCAFSLQYEDGASEEQIRRGSPLSGFGAAGSGGSFGEGDPGMLVARAHTDETNANEPIVRDDAVAGELFAKAMLIRGVEQRLLQPLLRGEALRHGAHLHRPGMDGDRRRRRRSKRVTSSSPATAATATSWRSTGDVEGLIAEVMGKQSGVCGGRGGSQHLCSRGRLQQRHPGRDRACRGRDGPGPPAPGYRPDRRRLHRRRHPGRGGGLRGVQHRLEMGAAAAGRAGEQPLCPEHARSRKRWPAISRPAPPPSASRRSRADTWDPVKLLSTAVAVRRVVSGIGASRSSSGSTPTA